MRGEERGRWGAGKKKIMHATRRRGWVVEGCIKGTRKATRQIYACVALTDTDTPSPHSSLLPEHCHPTPPCKTPLITSTTNCCLWKNYVYMNALQHKHRHAANTKTRSSFYLITSSLLFHHSHCKSTTF